MTSAYKTGQHCTRLTSKNLHLGYQDRFCSVPSVVRSWTSLKMEMTVCLANNATMKNQLIVGGRLALVLHSSCTCTDHLMYLGQHMIIS